MRLEWRTTAQAGPALGLLFGSLLVFGGVAAATWLALGLPMPVCKLRALTGVPCPTCGSTRLTESLLRGDLVGAFLANPFVFAVLAAIASWFVGSAVVRLFKLPIPALRLQAYERRLFYVAVVVALLASWAWVIWRDS